MADYTIEKLKDADGNNFAFRDPTKATPADITNALSTHNSNTSAHSDIRTALDGKFDGFELQSDGFADTTKIGLGSASGTKILAQQAIMLWNYIKGKANAVYAAISHTHSIANVTGLQDNLNHKASALNIRGSGTDFIRSILVLCKAYESATGSYFSGSITFRRSNGFNDPKYAIAALNAKHNTGARGALLSTVNYNSNSDMTTGVGIRLVEFTYNEIKYAGIECHEAAKWSNVNIIGYWNDFTPFIVDWYNTNTHTVLNQEIADSIHFITERYDFRLTSHSVITNLASTAAATFDGSANITPGVTGILPITNGGTGATTPEGADYNITAAVRKALGAIDGNYRIVCAQTAPSTSLGNLAGHRTFNQVWDWIKSKISSVLGLTATNYGGKAATAGTADKATDSDKLGGQLPSYYATKSEIPDVSGKENTSNKVTTLDNSTTHYPSTSAVTTALSGKQDTISDIATIRSNAENGQTAYGWGDHANAGYLTDADLSGYHKDYSYCKRIVLNVPANNGVIIQFDAPSSGQRLVQFFIRYGKASSAVELNVGMIVSSTDVTSCIASILANGGLTSANYPTDVQYDFKNGEALLFFRDSNASNTKVVEIVAMSNADVDYETLFFNDTVDWTRVSLRAFPSIDLDTLLSGGGIGSPTQPVYVDESGQVTACEVYFV